MEAVKTKKLLEQKNLVMEHAEEKNYVILRWVGFQTEEDIYRSGEKILEIFKKLDCSKIINDNREVRGPWNKASEWTQNVWFPQMIEDGGLKKFAWLFPENVFAELSATKAMPDNELIKKFQGFSAAENWLMED